MKIYTWYIRHNSFALSLYTYVVNLLLHVQMHRTTYGSHIGYALFYDKKFKKTC